MSRTWRVVTFADAPMAIIDGDRGKNYPKHTEFTDTGHCLFLNAGNVTRSGFEFSTVQFINESKDELLRKGKLSRDDVVMTTRGTIGNVAYYSRNIPYEHVRINSGMVIFRCNQSQLSPVFLYEYLRSPGFRAQVGSLQSGVAQPQLPIRDIQRVQLPLPPIIVQSRIADILSAYDDLIENNRRRIALLEEAARMIYKEWFVRLRFPGHEKVRIVDGVPEGWEITTIKSIGEIVTGKTPSTSIPGNYGGDIPFIKTPDMHGSIFIIETTTSLTEQGADTQKNKYIPAGSIMVSCIGTIGVVAIASELCQTNQQINTVILKDKNDSCYCYFALKSLKEAMEALGGGATMPNVNKSKFESLELMWPSITLREMFNTICSAFFSQILNLQRQNKKLQQARDILLPRLMSGEIEVSEDIIDNLEKEPVAVQ